MNFAQPAFLWALAGTAIPVAIHLLSRKEGKVVKVGSLRHMEESNTSRFKSIRLNESLLLLTRCLMIIWLALFLSGASCTSYETKNPDRWLVIEQGIESQPQLSKLIDSLTSAGAELHYLLEDFPTSRRPAIPGPPDYWKLAEELGKKSDHEILVVAYNRMKGFRQNRSSLPVNIKWIVVDPPDNDFVIAATLVSKDSAVIRKGHSDATGTSFASEKRIVVNKEGWASAGDLTDSARIARPDSITVMILSEDKYKRDAQVLRAALRALKTIPTIIITEADVTKPDWTFWLRDERPSKLESKMILMRPAEAHGWIRQKSPLEWHLTRRLTADETLKDHFMIALAQTFLPPPPEKLNNEDVRSLPEAMTWSTAALANVGTSNGGQDMALALMVLFLLTWIGERTLALRRNL